MKTFPKILPFLLIAGVMLVMNSCGLFEEDPGDLQAAQKTLTVSGFNGVRVEGPFYVTLTQGAAFSAALNGDRRNLDDVIAEVNGSTLVIRYRNSKNRVHTTYATIVIPELIAGNFSGAAQTYITGFIGGALNFSLSGASKANVNISAETLTLHMSGASELSVWGSEIGEKLDLDISGASMLDAFNLSFENAKVVASGASKAKINVSQSLDADASGASSIVYRGSPSVNSRVSGASIVAKD